MIRILREVTRVFSSYRRWHAGVIERGRMERGQSRRDNPFVQKTAASAPATIIDLAGARRLRCLSEPCGNTRLAIALLRSDRRVQR